MLEFQGSIHGHLLRLVPNVLVEAASEHNEESVSAGRNFGARAQETTDGGPALPGELRAVVVLALVPQSLVRATSEELDGAVSGQGNSWAGGEDSTQALPVRPGNSIVSAVGANAGMVGDLELLPVRLVARSDNNLKEANRVADGGNAWSRGQDTAEGLPVRPTNASWLMLTDLALVPQSAVRSTGKHVDQTLSVEHSGWEGSQASAKRLPSGPIGLSRGDVVELELVQQGAVLADSKDMQETFGREETDRGGSEATSQRLPACPGGRVGGCLCLVPNGTINTSRKQDQPTVRSLQNTWTAAKINTTEGSPVAPLLAVQLILVIDLVVMTQHEDLKPLILVR